MPTERERALKKKRAELARTRDRLLGPDLTAGMAREMREQVMMLECEIAELEGSK